MIRASLKGINGSPDVALAGLVRENMLSLQRDEPVFQPAGELGMPGLWILIAQATQAPQMAEIARVVSLMRGVPPGLIVGVALSPATIASALARNEALIMPPRRLRPNIDFRLVYAPTTEQLTALLNVPKPPAELKSDEVAHWMPDLGRYVMTKREPGGNVS